MLSDSIRFSEELPPDPFLLQQVFGALPGLYLFLSPELTIRAASQSYLRELMLEREAIVGKPLLEVFPNQEEESFGSPFITQLRASLEQVLATRQPHEMDRQRYRLPDPNQPGNFLEHYWRVSTIPVLNRQGEVVGLIHQIENVTEHVKTKQELQASQAREENMWDQMKQQHVQLNAIFEQAPVAFTILRGEQYIVELANPAVLKMWTRSREEVLGISLFVAMPELRHQGVEELLDGVRRSGKPHVGKELPVVLHRHGVEEIVYFNFIYNPLYDEKGTISGIAVVATDVSEQVLSRKRMETTARQLQELNEALEERVADRTKELQVAREEAESERSLLYSLFMQAPAMIAMVRGPEMVYELVNPLYQQQLFPGRILLGKPLLEAVPEIKDQPISDILHQVYSSGEPFAGTEMPILLDRAGNGQLETIYFNFIYQPLRNAAGKVDGIISFAYNVTEQVAARRQVEENEKHFRTLLESIPQMAWTATAEGDLNYFSTKWYAYTGQTPAEALGSGWTKATHPDDIAPILPLWQQALQTGTPYQVECRYRRAADQSWRWHLTRATPLRNETGAVFQWVGTCTDIHEQTLYTQQLLEREAYFRRMADNVPVMIWMTRSDGYCTYLNKPWYDYTGQTKEEAQGLGWLSATHPDDASRSEEAFLAANNQQIPFLQVYRLRRKDGTYRWFFDKGEPKYDQAGNFEGFVGVVIDVHEQYQAEERLLLSVKAGKVGVWEWDTVHNRATYSDLLQEMFGLEGDRFRGEFEHAYEVYQSVIHPDDWPQVNGAVEKAFHNRETEFYIEFRIVRPSGEIAWIAERGEVIFEGQQAVRMNGTCIDITDRKRAEQEAQRMSEELAALNEELAASNEELRAANEEIQAANEELGQSNQQLAHINADLDNFVYTASHDLKAPILNIEGLLQALDRQLSGEIRQSKPVQQIYELLYNSVARFKNTIRDLTEVARIGKESQEDIASIDLAAILKEVQQDLEPQIREAGAQIEESLNCPEVYFSRKNLKSVLYNLLSNAVKYRSPERALRICITCQTQETHHLLTVEDNGLGMDMRQEEKIFALFKRLHSHVEGTGIGLYIVKKMLQNAGGSIEVESEIGRGSTFRVFFKR